MTEMDPHEIDKLLRRTMAAPVPALPKDFDQRVTREVRGRSQAHGRYQRLILGSYAAASVVISAVVMRGQGLDWTTTAAMILGSLALVATVPLVRRLAI